MSLTIDAGRNLKYTCNFGKDKDGKETAPLKEAIEGYTQVPAEEKTEPFYRLMYGFLIL